MTNKIDDKLKSLNIDIPDIAPPAAAYVPFIVSGTTVYVSGQLPISGGQVGFKGTLGDGVDVSTAQKAARQCAINLIACLKAACGGDLTKVKRVLHLQVLVASTQNFNEQHVVANGASNLFVEVFGEKTGAHTRAAYGVASIPLGACVEIAGTFEIQKI